MKLTRKNPKSYFDLTFEEVKEKLDNLGIKLFDNEEWDCYDIYPQYTMRGLGSTEYTQDRSEESLKEAFKKGLQMAKKAGKFSKITFNQSESSAKRKKSNPDDTYSLWKDLSSRDSTKARKAALALKQHFAGKSKLSDFWSIVREESNLTVSEIKAKIESVIKKTSGARVNPENNFREKLNQLRMQEVSVHNPPWNTLRGSLKYINGDMFRVRDLSKDEMVEFPADEVIKIIGNKITLDSGSWAQSEKLKLPARKNPQTSLGFFPFETQYSPDQIESLIIYADEINGLKEKGKFVAADKKLQKLENLCGKRLAEKVVAWRKYNKY